MKISGELLCHSLPYDLRMCLTALRACLSLPYPRLGKQAFVSAPSPPVLGFQAQRAGDLNSGAHPDSKPSFPQAQVLFACFGFLLLFAIPVLVFFRKGLM